MAHDSAKTAPKVLISDKMDPLAAEIFKKNGVEVDEKYGLKPDELAKIIGDYDGLAIRSSTTMTPDLIRAAKNMKVIGRAGIGIDNVDVPAATEAGIVVMNTPFGNSITTAEHTIAMMFALARQLPEASASTHAGKWEKSKFMGVEVYNKTLGVIGCGNIGAIVISRALGLQMKVIGYDPFLTEDRARELGIEKVELDTLFARADFITLHVPKNEKTANIINKDSLAKMKKGVRIINCARGGLINEADLKAALDSGHVAGAALDVFEVEPAKDNILFGHPNLVCTPHLGASTSEAQVNVAIQVAEQMSDFLLRGAVANAVNTASISAEDAPKLKPYMALAEQLGRFAGQLAEKAAAKIEIEYRGAVSRLNTKPLTATILCALLRQQLDTVNTVNAASLAKARGITVSETKTEDAGDFGSAIRVTVTEDGETRSVAGTLAPGQQPRLISIDGVDIEAAVTPYMLYMRNDDKPGFIGSVGTILGEAKLNIADFRLGRIEGEDTAVALVSLDSEVPAAIYAKIAALPQIEQIRQLRF